MIWAGGIRPVSRPDTDLVPVGPASIIGSIVVPPSGDSGDSGDSGGQASVVLES